MRKLLAGIMSTFGTGCDLCQVPPPSNHRASCLQFEWLVLGLGSGLSIVALLSLLLMRRSQPKHCEGNVLKSFVQEMNDAISKAAMAC